MDEFASSMPIKRRDLVAEPHLVLDLLLVTALWALAAFVVNPLGDFPLNDDWAYGRTVQHFLDTGEYRPESWSSTALLTNVFWGALFCLPVGFSFTALRISTLVASLVGLFGAYILIRDLGRPRRYALILVGTLAANPIFYSLSHTFMTDAPFISIVIWSTVFFSRVLMSGSSVSLVIATVLALSATLSREVGLCVPAAFAVVLPLIAQRSMRTLARAVCPLIVCIGGMYLYKHWLIYTNSLPAMWDIKTQELMDSLKAVGYLPLHICDVLFVAALYLGIGLLPIALYLNSTALIGKIKTLKILSGAALGLSIGAAIHVLCGKDYGNSLLMPLAGNVLAKSGIGPLMLRDTAILKLNHVAPLSKLLWVGVTALAIGGAVLFIGQLYLSLREQVALASRKMWALEKEQAAGVFLLLCAAVYFVPVSLVFVWDRYFIPMIFLFGAGLIALHSGGYESAAGTKVSQVAALAFVSVVAALSVCMTRDYLEWNRVRWTAINTLMQEDHVRADDIDGGFEFNGLLFYEARLNFSYNQPDTGTSWWWVKGNHYQIAFGPVPQYEIFREYTYSRWLPPGRQALVVLRRE